MHRILLVDDDMLMRKMVTQQLLTLGYTDTDTAIDGFEAHTKLEDAYVAGTAFSIVLLDWHMPEMNGFEFLRKCRADMRFKSLVIIMITAESEPKNILMAMKAGANGYIVKPLSLEALTQKMHDAVITVERNRAFTF